jgi:hypothetical protein
MREEAKDKLKDSWRGESVQTLLRANNKLEVTPKAAAQEALFHLHSHFQNTYFQIYLLRRQVSILALVLAAAVLTTVVVAQGGHLYAFDRSAETRVPLVVLFGFLGAALSAIMAARDTPGRTRIPEVHRSGISALIRPLIGGASALPVYALIQSELINVQIADSPEATILAFAFFAGFSERWFLRKVEPSATRTSNGETRAGSGQAGRNDGSQSTADSQREEPPGKTEEINGLRDRDMGSRGTRRHSTTVSNPKQDDPGGKPTDGKPS